MLRPADEQRMIDAEVARAAELLRQHEEWERAEQCRQEEEHWRNEQENQRLQAELDREQAEHERQRRSTSTSAELLDLRRRVAALEQTVAELVRAQQGPARGVRFRVPAEEPIADASPAD